VLTAPTIARITTCASLVHEIPADEDNLPGVRVEGQTTLSQLVGAAARPLNVTKKESP
jgi:hypothetical protein